MKGKPKRAHFRAFVLYDPSAKSEASPPLPLFRKERPFDKGKHLRRIVQNIGSLKACI